MNLILFLIVNVVFCYMATVGFGVILNIPRRGLNACGIVGVIGWLVYVCIKDCFSSSMLANLLAAFSIGMGAMFCARFKKMPMILFNIPSLVPLVPGGRGISCRALFCDWKKRFGFELSCSSRDDCRFDCGRFLFGRVRIPGLF